MNELRKQAILIMCHEDFYILEKTIELLDNERIDFFIHVDSKVKEFDFDKIKNIPKKSNIFFIDRMNVIWGSFSQIEVELKLLKEALKKDNYSYLHLISGIDLPLKNSNELIKYFDDNYPTEYVEYLLYDNIDKNYLDRVKYFHFIGPKFRDDNKERLDHHKYIKLQKELEIDRTKNKNIQFRKGANWFSITSELAKYVLTKEDFIKDNFSYGYCVDEMFLQTVLYSSEFFKNVCRKYDNVVLNCMRLIDWTRGIPYIYRKSDYDELMSSSAMFARKFSTKVDKEIIDMIYEKLRQ